MYTSSLIDTLTCQAFFSPTICRLLERLVHGHLEDADQDADEADAKSAGRRSPPVNPVGRRPSMTKTTRAKHRDKRDLSIGGFGADSDSETAGSPDGRRGIAHLFTSGMDRGALRQIGIPREMRRVLGACYGDLFRTLVTKRGMIPLGLYRAKGSRENTESFVFTNPPASTRLDPGDRVFVLTPMDEPDDAVVAAQQRKISRTAAANASNAAAIASKMDQLMRLLRLSSK